LGHFIFKFLKELNSATSSKMMVLAIILGLISGFLPTVNFFTILIFIIVLVFRIPVGLFLASFSFFKFIGYFCDSVFNQIGLFFLKASFLNSFWTFLYNLPFLRWSGFNNTVVMGSLISGIVLGLILYFILIKLVTLYRNIVFEKLKTKKYLSWLVPNEEKGVIRIAGIGLIVAVSAVGAVFFIFLLNPIIKNSLEFTLSKITHKKVAIESVNASLKNLSVNIKNMQIGDILFQKVYTKLDWNKIIWKKYKIDDLEFIAKTDKNIYDLINSAKTTSKTKNSNSFISGLDLNIKLPKPEEFLAKQNLKSVAAIKKLQNDYKKVQTDIKSLKIDKYKKEFNDLKNKINSMKHIKIKSPEDLTNLVKNINNIKKESNNLLKKIKKDKHILSEDKKLISDDIKSVKLALKTDKENIKSKYKMLQNREYMQFTQSILKPQISKYLQLADNLYQKVKPYMNHQKNEKEEIYRRDKGVYIAFKDKIIYPDFVLVKSLGEVKTSIAKWSVRADNISDNQIMLNKKALINIKGVSKFFDAGVTVFYLKKIEFNGYGKKINIKKMNMNFANLNALLNSEIKGEIFNQNINSKITAYFNNVKFTHLKNNFKRILGDSLSSVKKFNVIINMDGKLNSPKIKINSDLDKIFGKILQSKINKLINKQRLKIENMLNSRIKSSLKDMNLNIVDLKINELNNLENIKKLIDEKALEIIKSKGKKSIGNTIRSLLPF